MGNSNSSVENDYLEQIKKIDEDKKKQNWRVADKERQRISWKSGEVREGKAEQTDISVAEITTV